MQLPEIAWLDLPTGPLAYRRSGTGDPLLLIHGWGGSWRYWIGAFATLAEHHDVIALDLPGFGASPPPRKLASLTELTAITSAAADALGLGVMTLGGHSLGASVALLLAAAQPTRVKRLVLASFGLPRTPEEETLFAGLHMQLQINATVWGPWLDLWAPWLAALRPWNQSFWLTPPMPALVASRAVYNVAEVPYGMLALGVADLTAMNLRVAIEAASASGDPSVTAAARSVAVPTLILSGREDQLFPPSAVTALARALSGSTLVMFDHCGHIPMAECPTPFYTTMETFLQA